MKLWYGFCAFLCCQLMVSASGYTPVHAALPQSADGRGFEVYVEKEGDWQTAGFIAFNNFFSEQKLQLGIVGKPLALRLKKVGSGPGHVDFVRVNGQPPRSVHGIDDIVPLVKLSEKDFDVVHVPEGSDLLELHFPTGGELHVAARIEGAVVSQTPFRFPPANTYAQITPESDFYNVSPDQEPRLIFSEETAPGTGHPWGMATASAMIRDDSLLVRLDFESDNTLDGGKDYASLHLRTGSGVKTFTIDQNDSTWGKANFGYTPGVPWQHKIYDFIIPLAELPPSGSIELAMSAYGTAAPDSRYEPALAYGSKNKEYMAAYFYVDLDARFQIQTQRYGINGAPVGVPFGVTDKGAAGKSETDIAYDSTNDRFLVAWTEDNGGVSYVHRQFVSSTNSLVGSVEFEVSPYNQGQRYPALAYSPASQRYLVAWQENNNTSPGFDDIYASVVDGNNQGSVYFAISTEPGFESRPRIAHMPGDDIFLVVWEDRRNGVNPDIYIRAVKPDGSSPGISSPVHVGPGSQMMPDIAHDPTSQLSLVVWQDSRNQADTGYDIHGMLLANAVLPIGDELIITNAPGEQWHPRVAYAGNGNFLVTWQDRGVSPNELRGRFYTSLGVPLGNEKVFKKFDQVDIYSPVLEGSGGRSLLAAYNYVDVSDGTMQIGTKAISATAGKLFLYLPAMLNRTAEE